MNTKFGTIFIVSIENLRRRVGCIAILDSVRTLMLNNKPVSCININIPSIRVEVLWNVVMVDAVVLLIVVFYHW